MPGMQQQREEMILFLSFFFYMLDQNLLNPGSWSHYGFCTKRGGDQNLAVVKGFLMLNDQNLVPNQIHYESELYPE